MTDTQTIEKPEVKPSTGGGTQQAIRHIVLIGLNGQPTDKCLCGHLWDRVFLPQGEDICQECVDVQRQLMSLLKGGN